MFPWLRVRIDKYERGLLFHRGLFERMLMPGDHFVFDPLGRKTLERVSVRHVSFTHRDLALIVRSGALAGQALVLDLRERERAFLWVEGRLREILEPGLHVLWTVFQEVHADVVDTGCLLRIEGRAAAGRRFHQGWPGANLGWFKAPPPIGSGAPSSPSGNLVPAVGGYEGRKVPYVLGDDRAGYLQRLSCKDHIPVQGFAGCGRSAKAPRFRPEIGGPPHRRLRQRQVIKALT